ncbi:MAG: cupin domain-containing protein [Pseudomonadota bacterium]
MKIVRAGEAASVQAPADAFTGVVWQNPIVTAPDPARVGAALVTFTPGARTFWHVHPLGQTLYITQGVGWFQLEGEARIEIKAGDVIFIEPNEKHWHGATATTTMSHVAMHERDGSSHVTWLEPVSEKDYLAAG